MAERCRISSGRGQKSPLELRRTSEATLLGSSQVFDVEDGKLGVGSTGYVYFVDFDRTRARTRKCKIIVMGE